MTVPDDDNNSAIEDVAPSSTFNRETLSQGIFFRTKHIIYPI